MILRRTYKGIGTCAITPEEKILAEKLGLVYKEEKESAISELLRVAQILKSNGVNLKKIAVRNPKDGKSKILKLSEIKQKGIDIGKIIDENRFRSGFSLWI